MGLPGASRLRLPGTAGKHASPFVVYAACCLDVLARRCEDRQNFVVNMFGRSDDSRQIRSYTMCKNAPGDAMNISLRTRWVCEIDTERSVELDVNEASACDAAATINDYISMVILSGGL